MTLREERDNLKAMNELLEGEVAIKCKGCNRHDIFEELVTLREVVEKVREDCMAAINFPDGHVLSARERGTLEQSRDILSLLPEATP